MLLRCSRSAEQLEKLAVGALLRSAGNVLTGAGKATMGAGRFMKSHWKPVAATALLGSAVAPMIASGYHRSQQGLSDLNYQQRMAGIQGPGFPKAPTV